MPHERITHGCPGRHGGGTGHGKGRGISSMIWELAVETTAATRKTRVETIERMRHQSKKVLLWDVSPSQPCTRALWCFTGVYARGCRLRAPGSRLVVFLCS